MLVLTQSCLRAVLSFVRKQLFTRDARTSRAPHTTLKGLLPPTNLTLLRMKYKFFNAKHATHPLA